MRALEGALILRVPAGIPLVRGFGLTRYLDTWQAFARQTGFDTRHLTYPHAAAGPSAGSEDAFPDGKPVPALSTLGGIHHDQRHP